MHGPVLFLMMTLSFPGIITEASAPANGEIQGPIAIDNGTYQEIDDWLAPQYWLGPVDINHGGCRSMAGRYSVIASTGQAGGIGMVSGESVTAYNGFWWAASASDITSPRILTAVSRLTHANGVGEKDIDLFTALSGCDVAVECRSNGPTRLIVTFDEPVRGHDGLDPGDVTLTSTGAGGGVVTSLSIAGNVLTVAITDSSDAARLTIRFIGIEDFAGNPVTDTLCLGVLRGDANGNGSVNVFDLLATRNTLNQPVGDTNFRNDVTLDGKVNVFDMLMVRNNLNRNIGVGCP